MLEAICKRCGETFIPADEDDTEHGVRNDGEPCGGPGEIVGEWVERTAADRLADARQWAGYCQAHFARTSGALIVVLDGVAAGLDTDGGRWSTLCDDHGTVIAHDTLALARAHAADPGGWCEGCQD